MSQDIVKRGSSPVLAVQQTAGGLVVEGYEGGVRTSDFQFPVAVLVQGAPREQKRDWYQASYKAGDIIVPGVGVIGGKNTDKPVPFTVLAIKKYHNIYGPKNAGDDNRVPPIKIVNESDAGHVTADDLIKLGWKVGQEFDNDKKGTFTLAQLEDVLSWTKVEGSDDDLAPLATEMRDMLCLSQDGTVFWFRMNSRRDGGQSLKLASTLVFQSSMVPCWFKATANQKTGGINNDIFHTATIAKMPGIVPAEHRTAEKGWQSILSNVKLEAGEEGETGTATPKDQAPKTPVQEQTKPAEQPKQPDADDENDDPFPSNRT